MARLHRNQQNILEYLLDHPSGAGLQELAEHLGLSKTAAKEHVVKLETAGLLTYKDQPGSVGRPKRHYLLSPAGHETFPRKYSWLSNSLLELLANEMGPNALQSIMGSLAEKVAQPLKAKMATAKSTAELLEMVNEAMSELGYRTRLRQSDIRKGAVIEATNCVYHSVAKEHPALCSFDIKLLENVTGGMKVHLEKCITRGDSVCRFCIQKRK